MSIRAWCLQSPIVPQHAPHVVKHDASLDMPMCFKQGGEG